MLVNLLADEDESDDEDDEIPRRPKTLKISNERKKSPEFNHDAYYERFQRPGVFNYKLVEN